MNRRRILTGLPAGLLLIGYWVAVSPWLFAQQGRPPAGRQERRNLETPELRVPQQQDDPELDRILDEWARATSKIEKLQGEHYRWVYDTVFEVEKRAIGKFYYEGPDKGRIDIEGRKIGPKDVSKRTGKDRKPFELQPDKPQRWICNGTEIQVIHDDEKTVEIVPIPKDAQGPNIMDSSLPFLFGLPPEKAKRRYVMRLDHYDPNSSVVTIEVLPRLQQDAANWRRAMVKLDRTRYLPQAVKLEDPAGSMETVYFFDKMEVNKKQTLFEDLTGKDVFNPKLRGYSRMVAPSAELADQPPGNGPRAGVVPLVKNMSLTEAKATLERAGYQVRYGVGEPAPQSQFVQIVYAQEPEAGTPLDKNQPVRITYYDFDDSGKKSPRRK